MAFYNMAQQLSLPDSTQTQYLAQAKFLRAFYYFYLVQTFGDVPLHLLHNQLQHVRFPPPIK